MIRSDLVLVGAGAAHLVALRRFAMHPLPAAARLTLVVPEATQPYSGAVPAVMAGRWTRAEATLDLAALARAAGARLILAKAIGLDLAAREIQLAGRPPLRWDLLALCPGAAPVLVPGVAEHALPLKPLGRLLDAWEAALRPDLRVVVAGGGAAGVEAALAARARLGPAAPVTLVTPAAPAGGLGARPARMALRALADAGVDLCRDRAMRVEAGRLVLQGGAVVPFDLCLWAGAAEPPAWLAASGLRQDAEGWFLAEPTLQAVGEPRIFLAGDIVAIRNSMRPRNGVFSVRQGLPLAENLRASLENRPLHRHRPQRRHLALLQALPGAIAAWGGLALRGAWALRWKERIDRGWVNSFRRLATRPMPSASPKAPMRCEGCGAKLPPSVLRGALARLGGLPGGADDAAMLPPMPAGIVQSVDMFRPPTDDPWVAGRIAAAHALGDLAAMGAEPRAALAMVALPHAAPSVLEEDLFQLLHGARSVLEPAGAALLGGHSAEAAEPMIGFSVTGEVAPGAALRRSGLRPGEVLVLTKPIGTGAVLAAMMGGAGHGAFLAPALTTMQVDPMPASRILRAHGATAAADVTGFGLLGHLGEMLAASGCGAVLDPRGVPALPGALEALSVGIRSTLHPGNEEALALVDGAEDLEPARLALLLDPQTSGGLLAGLPEERAASCLAALRRAGVSAVAIGRTIEGPPRIGLQPDVPLPRLPPHEHFDRHRSADPGEPVPAAAG